MSDDASTAEPEKKKVEADFSNAKKAMKATGGVGKKINQGFNFIKIILYFFQTLRPVFRNISSKISWPMSAALRNRKRRKTNRNNDELRN